MLSDIGRIGPAEAYFRNIWVYFNYAWILTDSHTVIMYDIAVTLFVDLQILVQL